MARTRHGLPGIYNSTPITLTNEEGAALAIDENGRLITSSGGTSGYAVDDSEMPATPSITPVGGEYRSTPTTYTDGDATVLQTDANGNVKVTKATLDAGEDLVNDVQKVETRGSMSYQAAAGANLVIKAGAGFLYGIIIGKDVASAVIEVSDHASDGDGAVRVYLEGSTLMTSCKGYVPVNAVFASGITADITNQTNVTFVYR